MRLFFVTAVLLGIAFSAQAAEPDAVRVVVPIQSRAQVDVLEGAGFSVDNASDTEATVYVPRASLPQLTALGFSYREAPEAPTAEKDLTAYHNYTALTAALRGFESAYPDLTTLVSIGKSAKGRDLWALLITDNPDVAEDEPEFKYVSTMHGDEPIGTELLINLADLLLSSHGTDTRLTNIVDNTALWFVPCMNPDGLEAVTRFNGNNVDLNRNFPSRTQITGTLYDGAPYLHTGAQPETRAVMTWSVLHNFVLSANFHSGSLVFNYLYDDDGLPSGQYAACPDDALVRELSLEYAIYNPPMYASPVFDDGVSNGTEWYLAVGSMQDWNYRYLGCIEGTIELNNVKKPAGSQLPTLWENNRESMLSYIETVQWGLRGKITDRNTGGPVYSRITVDDNPQPVFSDPEHGDYYRMLLQGQYDVTFEAPGHITYHSDNVNVPDRDHINIDVQLSDGDLNKDGTANAADIQLMVNALLQRIGAPSAAAADVDGMGLSASDLQALINFVVGR